MTRGENFRDSTTMRIAGTVLLTPGDGGRLCYRTAMSSHDIVGFQVGRIEERHDDSRSPGCSAARTVEDGLHFRDQRDWEGIWTVRERGIHEHAALAADSGAAGDCDGD